MGFLAHLVSVLVVIFAVCFTFFANYPAPPMSPILHQWKELGKEFDFYRHKIFYIDKPGDGKEFPNSTVLVLHGFPTSSFDFFKVWPHLKATFGRVVMLDFLGHGFSSKPRRYTYSIIEQADMVERLLEYIDVQDVHVWAHDYGDTVAQELLARQSESGTKMRIQSLCMMNGGIFPGLHRALLMQRILKFPIVGTILSKFSNYYMFQLTLRSVFAKDTEPSVSELHDFWALARYNEGYRVMGDVLSYMDERNANEDRWVGALKSTKVKLHFIYGKKDPINPPPFEEYYRKMIKNGRIVVFENIGHYPHLESPQQTAMSYLEFLQGLNL